MPIEYIALLIPFAGMAIGAFAIWTDHKQKMVKRQAEIAAAESSQGTLDRKQLEERVAVLERIITDQGYSVAQEIEKLRSEPGDSGVPLPEFKAERETAA